MRGTGTSRRDFEKKWVKIGHFREKRASRKPYKASEKLESHDTALFAIFCHRGSSEPTEAFCLCLRGKIETHYGSHSQKMYGTYVTPDVPKKILCNKSQKSKYAKSKTTTIHIVCRIYA